MSSRELLCVHVGHAGAHIGDAAWAQVLVEHGLGADGFDATGTAVETGSVGATSACRRVLFDESAAGKHVPRALFVDTEPDAAVALRAHGARRSLYHPRRGVAPPPSAALAGGVFAAAACSAAGRACAEAAASELRGMAEACDTPDGIHVTLAAGGGAGAGLGTLLLQELELEVGRMPTMVHALFPSAVHASSPLEAYNTALGLRALTDSADAVSVMDNGALSARCAAALDAPAGGGAGARVSLRELNAAAGAAVAAASAPLRLGGSPRGGVASLAADVAPYPRLHFVLPTLAPLLPAAAAAFERLAPRDVVAAALAPDAAFASADAGAPGAATLAAALTWRGGGVHAADVAAAAAAVAASAAAARSVDWAPSGPAVYVVRQSMPTVAGAPFAALPRSALALVNSSAFGSHVLAAVGARFDAAFAFRAHVAAYAAEGLEVAQLREAREDLAALMEEYEAAAADTLPGGGAEGAPAEWASDSEDAQGSAPSEPL